MAALLFSSLFHFPSSVLHSLLKSVSAFWLHSPKAQRSIRSVCFHFVQSTFIPPPSSPSPFSAFSTSALSPFHFPFARRGAVPAPAPMCALSSCRHRFLSPIIRTPMRRRPYASYTFPVASFFWIFLLCWREICGKWVQNSIFFSLITN